MASISMKTLHSRPSIHDLPLEIASQKWTMERRTSSDSLEIHARCTPCTVAARNNRAKNQFKPAVGSWRVNRKQLENKSGRISRSGIIGFYLSNRLFLVRFWYKLTSSEITANYRFRFKIISHWQRRFKAIREPRFAR